MNLNDRLIRIQRSGERLEDISANRLQSLVKNADRLKPEQGDSILKKKIIDNLVQDLAADLDIKQLDEREIYQVAKRVEEITDQVMNQEGKFASRAERQKIIEDILDEIIGLGPLEPLLKDPDITEIMVNSPTNIYIEREGKISRAAVAFRDNDHILQVIDKIVSPLGRRIDESSPMVDARLPDGSRVNAVIPPLSVHGPCITIRKFSKEPYGIDDLVSFGTLSAEMAQFLRACVQARINILVSGGTGSGKTTTLNVLSSFIPDDERIITIEDAAELQLHQEHVITLESRPPNIEGKGRVTIRDLVINSLRMRPDRIIVGEVRGAEALDMLQAMNTGHDGSITTCHANSARDALARIETMVLMAGTELPSRAIREQISSALNLIVHQNRLKDGTRKITAISEIVGMEGNTITLQDIFVFEQSGMDAKGNVIGRFRPTGIVPTFIETFKTRGINIAPGIFGNRTHY
jgi:pilus assembly protein CpaF